MAFEYYMKTRGGINGKRKNISDFYWVYWYLLICSLLLPFFVENVVFPWQHSCS